MRCRILGQKGPRNSSMFVFWWSGSLSSTLLGFGACQGRFFVIPYKGSFGHVGQRQWCLRWLMWDGKSVTRLWAHLYFKDHYTDSLLGWQLPQIFALWHSQPILSIRRQPGECLLFCLYRKIPLGEFWGFDTLVPLQAFFPVQGGRKWISSSVHKRFWNVRLSGKQSSH